MTSDLYIVLAFAPLVVIVLLGIAVLWKRHVEDERDARIADAIKRQNERQARIASALTRAQSEPYPREWE